MAGGRDSPLSAELTTVNIETADTHYPFEALSYVWGDNAKVDTIKTPGGCIPITKSLSVALKSYRRPDKDHLLWADAICINQNDNGEKAKAVERMADAVYGKADRVLIFLGSEEDDSALAGELITRIVEEKWDRKKTRQDRFSSSSNAAKWRAFEAVLRRPWFRRVWVVQEFVVSKEAVMTCGGWSVDAMALLLVAWYFRCDLCVPLQNLLFLRKTYQLRQVEPDSTRYASFALILYLGKRLDATLACDHLFAFFSFNRDPRIGNQSDLFRVDYNESLSSVVRRYARGFIEADGLESLLYYASLDGENDHLPSWIPNWFSKVNLFSAKDPLDDWPTDASRGLEGNHMYVPEEQLSTWIASILLANPEYDDEDEVEFLKHGFQDFLGATGGYVDELVKVGESGWRAVTESDSDLTLDGAEYLKRLNSFLRDSKAITDSITTYPTGESIKSALAKKIMCHRTKGLPTEAIEEDYEMFTTLASFKEGNLQLTLKIVHGKLGKLQDLLPNAGWSAEDTGDQESTEETLGTARSYEAILLQCLDLAVTNGGRERYETLWGILRRLSTTGKSCPTF